MSTADNIPHVFVVVPVHNRKAITRKFLSCLAAQTYKRVRLLLIDDGSTDGTAEMVRGVDPAAVILTGDGHLWWSGCMQMAYEWLLSNECNKEDLVFVANDDIMFGPELISSAVGSILIQGLIAAIAAVGVTLRLYWHRFIAFFKRSKKSAPSAGDEETK